MRCSFCGGLTKRVKQSKYQESHKYNLKYGLGGHDLTSQLDLPEFTLDVT